MPATGHSAVLGIAGSGKTTLALYRAAYLSETSMPHAGRTLLLTFNKALVTYLKYLKPAELRNVQIETYHTFARGYLNVRGKMRFNCICSDPDERKGYISRAVKAVESGYEPFKFFKRPIEFFMDEIQWIFSHGITSSDEYVKVDRVGRIGTNLSRKLRPVMYEILEKYVELRNQTGNMYDWDDLALHVRKEFEDDDSITWQQIGDILKEALSKSTENEVGDPDESLLNKLFDKQHVLRGKYRAASEELRSYINLKKNSGGYGAELKEQNARLESIGLFSADVEGHTCPLCSSALQDEIPAVGAIKTSLASTKHQLEAVTNETPHLDKLIQAAEDACDQIRIEMTEVKTSIISLQKTNERLSELRDQNARVAMVKGRLSLYLEHMPEGEVDFSTEIKEADTLKQQIIKLEEDLDDDALTERISSALSVISSKITSLAQRLGIEHSDSPMRLDLKKLTVVADTEDGPIPMPKMGSAETWVGLHLVTHLALHNWFVKKSRPVPQFLFLDQPSQAYFPPDTSAETVKNETDAGNPDRQSVIKMFQLVVSETQNFQVVITEHADIQEEWFQNLVREKWWDGKTKLIPMEWLEDE